MNKYNFDQLINRRNTSSYKWDVKDNELPMWVADMDFAVLPEIIKAIKERADISAYGYVKCPDEYFLCYSSWWKKHHHIDIDPKDMIYCTGVVAAIDSIFKHVLPPQSGIVVQSPVYHVFFNCVRNNNHELLNNQLIVKDNEYSINFKELEELLSKDNTKALLLCNPHNPIGRIWNKDELNKIASLCEKYNVLIISDEIHCDIAEPGCEYNSILSITNNAIALISPTKAFNIAGIQAACIVCPNKELHELIEKGVGQDDVGEPNYFSPYASIAAYTYGEEWIKQMNEYVFNNKKYFIDFINNEMPALKVVDNKATYLLWVDISSISHDSEIFSKDLRNKTGLFVSPGCQFGPGGENYFRINIATSLDNIKDACNRLKNYVKSL